MAFVKIVKLPEMISDEEPKNIDLGNGFKLDYEIKGGFDSQYDDEYTEQGWPTTFTVYDNNDLEVAEIEGPEFNGTGGEEDIIEANRVAQEKAINDIVDRLPEIIEAKIAQNEQQNGSLSDILANEPKGSEPGL